MPTRERVLPDSGEPVMRHAQIHQPMQLCERIWFYITDVVADQLYGHQSGIGVVEQASLGTNDYTFLYKRKTDQQLLIFGKNNCTQTCLNHLIMLCCNHCRI